MPLQGSNPIFKFFFTLLLAVLLAGVVSWQSGGVKVIPYRSPLNIPLVMSGNFAEPRENHLHTGIDFKTEGKTGLPVYAVQDGYVSRINVSPFGYGKALYITHPDGYTSVYGHLQGFNERITSLLEDSQYHYKRFSVDLYLPKNSLVVKQGELIGRSGNSGSSGGPHLHFELRDSLEFIINPHAKGIQVQDRIQPKIQGICFTDFSKGTLQKNQLLKSLTDKQGKTISDAGLIRLNASEVGISILAKDYHNGSGSDLGIYSVRLRVNGVSVFYKTCDRFSFAQKRSVFSVVEYSYFEQKSSSVYYRCYREPGNVLKDILTNEKSGKIALSSQKPVQVKVEVTDFFGNQSSVSFQLLQDQSLSIFEKISAEAPGEIFYPRKNNRLFLAKEVLLESDSNVFFDTTRVFFRWDNRNPAWTAFELKGNGFFNQYARLSLPVVMAEQWRAKAIALLYQKSKWTSKGGYWERNKFCIPIRDFGAYKIALDTVPPVVVPVGWSEGKDFTGKGSIKVKISDAMSGVKSFDTFIDGKWMLSEWDGKTGMVITSGNRIKPGPHVYLISVVDERENKTSFSMSFTW